MNKPPQSSSDSSGKQKPEINILSILVLSLFIGLIAGAGVDKSYILPIAFISAVILFINRDKIASTNTTVQPDKSSQQDINPAKGYYAWPELGQFACRVAAEPYQNTIRQLAQENTVSVDDDSTTKMRILKAHLIPDYSNPYDSDFVRIDIHNRTVGHLNRKQARSFHHRLNEKGLSNQITTCNAIITKNNKMNENKTADYGVKLDIEPFA